MSESRILKWIIPVDDQEHRVLGEFLHAEPMTAMETEQGANIRARNEGISTGEYTPPDKTIHPDEWVTVWTRVSTVPVDRGNWTDDDLSYDSPDWWRTYLYRVFATGQPIEDNHWFHSATVRHDGFRTPLVWHVMHRDDDQVRIVEETRQATA